MRIRVLITILLFGLGFFVGCSQRNKLNETPFSSLTEDQKIAIAQENAEACNCCMDTRDHQPLPAVE
jgi:hypothetical protein